MATLKQVDEATRSVAIRKSEYGRLFNMSPAGVAGQVARGGLKTIRIGGTEMVDCAALRASVGLPPAE